MKWLALTLLLFGCSHTFDVGDQSTGSSGGTSGGGVDAGSAQDAGCLPASAIVKILFLVDESGAMCVFDPPGAQSGNGFCEQVGPAVSAATGQVKPARVDFLEQLVTKFQTEGSDIKVAILPYETNPMPQWPASGGFALPDSTAVQFTDDLPSQLGNGSNLQGALATAQSLLQDDMQAAGAAALANTHYAVVLLSAGLPFPRCTASTSLPAQDTATATRPWLTWANDSTYCTEPFDAGAICETTDGGGLRCNTPDVPGVAGFDAGTDLNQDYQLVAEVQALVTLGAKSGAAVTFDSVQFFDSQAVTACGTLCTDLTGDFPGLSLTDSIAAGFLVGQWTLGQFANGGAGNLIEAYAGPSGGPYDGGFVTWSDGGPSTQGLLVSGLCVTGP